MSRLEFVTAWTDGVSVAKIAAIANRSASWVSKHAHDLGLPSRVRMGAWRSTATKKRMKSVKP